MEGRERKVAEAEEEESKEGQDEEVGTFQKDGIMHQLRQRDGEIRREQRRGV